MTYHFIIILLSYPHIISTLITRTKNTFTFQYNDTYWKSLSHFTPINNASYGNIKLGRSLRMEFKFMYHSATTYNYTENSYYHENAFRIGFNNKNNRGDGAGSRYPSMWIYYIDSVPKCKFSISNEINNWKQFANLYTLNKHFIYSVIIQFSQNYIFISITNNNETYIVIDGERSPGTAKQYLDEYMYIWISQFGHNEIITPPANITMFDIIINTWDHTLITPTLSPVSVPSLTPMFEPSVSPIITPTMNPLVATTVSPSTYSPTKAPLVITSIISSEPIEIYVFYDESIDEYKEKVDVYAEFVYDSILLGLENVTRHSMDINDGDDYSDKAWIFGGVYDFIHCMLFNNKMMGIHIDCPLIPQPHNEDFEYVAVGLLYLESDGNITDFREYIMEHMSSTQFMESFRESLNHIVMMNHIVLNKKNEWIQDYVIGTAEILLCVVIVLCLILCVVWRVYYERKTKQRKGQILNMQNISDDDDIEELSETRTHFPIERT